MLTSLTPAALALLISIPGLPGLHLRRPARPAPADTLPPAWQTASLLTLEDQFVFATLRPLVPGPSALRLAVDPRRLRVGFDPDSGTVSVVPEVAGVQLGRPARLPLDSYARELTALNFQRLWNDRSHSSINSLGANTPAPATTGISLQLPSPLPRRVQSLLGPGGPALTVSGMENIRLSGQSSWTNQQVGLLGQRRSLFPSLDMQQDLDIKLEGQLSDRVRVNLLQNSANQIPLANRIAINYKGSEDDLIQQFDLGNTNLSLPGTQYVSYSGKNEGLFGVKAASRLGPLDLTVLASKQEGRSERAQYAGGAAHQTSTLLDADYVQGVYFFLYDPNQTVLDIDETSIKVYEDDATTNDVNTIRGRALLHPEAAVGDSTDTLSVRGSFKLLNPGADQDYEILNNVYTPLFRVLRLRRQVIGNQRLAVTYNARPVNPATGQGVGPFAPVGGEDSLEADGQVARRMKLIRAPADLLRPDPTGKFYDTTRPFYPTRDLELRNFYQLGGQRIDPKTFKLTIRKGNDDPPVTFMRKSDVISVPYIEALGLDNLDETSGHPVPGHDGQVDGTAPTANYRVFVDYENGVLFFFDLRPFAPRLNGPGARPFEQFLSSLLSRRDSLVGADTSANAANPAIYDKYNLQRLQDAVYYMDVDYTASRAGNEIVLGRGNIIEGSEAVSINSQTLVRDRDYTIDYDLGRIRLIRQLGPADQLNVDYAYAPLFQQAGRTLVGSAFRLEGRDRSVGGAFLYESRGAQDLRPRLGEEPSRSLIGDLNTDWQFRPAWMTRLVDRLPGVRTTAPSDFRVQAEAGASFPNPNTRNEIFIDDMEGVRDAVSVSMGPERWRWSSMPSRKAGGLTSPIGGLPRQHGAETHWYSPPAAIKEKELKPNLTQAQGAENPHQVLALSVPRRPTSAVNPDTNPFDFDTLWAGVTYPLDAAGLDLSRSQFIEVWVNDFNDEHVPGAPEPRIRGRNVKLHIDLGRVSEDEVRSPDRSPDGLLNSEDKPLRDNLLTVTEGNNEDTGLDGRVDPSKVKASADLPETTAVLDLLTAGPDDPEGDDFHSTDEAYKEVDPRRYRFTNGTEGNKNFNPTPDTEDLNLNNNLDTEEDYFEYTIDLGDPNPPYLVTDVQRDFPGRVTSDNGWRRYRIPIADTLAVRFGIPDLTLARHVRVWVEGLVNVDPSPDSVGTNPVRPILMLGSLEIVGSRWQATAIDTAAKPNSRRTTVTLNTVNTVDNADIYVPPFDPGETRTGSQGVRRREQALALEFTELQAGDTLEAFKTFSIDEDYTRYGNLDWFAAGYQVQDYVPGSDSLDYFVRIASDANGQNYYEYRAPVASSSSPGAINWREVKLRLTEISGLKLRPNFPRVDPILFRDTLGSGEIFTLKGRPSFTRVRRISFGLINRNPDRAYPAGQLWFDELRATDVKKDAGHAQRVLVNGHFANLLSYNFAWSGRDPNFLSVGENRGSGVSTDQINLNTSMDLHRFFQGTGIVLPVSYSYARNSSKPRFTAGDDVVRTDVQANASETRTETRSWSAQYSRVWTERSSPFLRYTVGGITSSIARGRSFSRAPTTLDTTTTLSATVNYGISPRNLLSVGLPATKAKFYPLPERVFWNYSIATRESHTYDVPRDRPDSLVLRNIVKGRSATINFGGDSRPVDLIHHHFEGVRNLTLAERLRQRVGFVNFGALTSWRQSFDSHYDVKAGNWVRPSLTWNSSYGQNNGPELSADLHAKSIGNGQTVALTWTLPFDRLAAQLRAAGDSGHVTPGRVTRGLLAHLGPLGTEAAFITSSSYTRLAGRPSLLYLVGLTGDPGFAGDSSAIRAEFGNQSARNNEWRTSAHTNVSLVQGVSIGTRMEYSWKKSIQNDLEHRGTSTRLPDLDLDYGRLPALIGLDRLLRNVRLKTAFSRSMSTDYLGGAKIETAVSDEYRPVLSLDGQFKNGTTANFKVENRATRRDNYQLGHTRRSDGTLDVSTGLNRQYSQGQKVNILGKQSVVRSSVTLGMTAVYSRRTGEQKRYTARGSQNQFQVKEDRLSVNGNGSYGFSNNVTGNVSLGFLQTRDLQRDIIRRSIRVEARAAFSF